MVNDGDKHELREKRSLDIIAYATTRIAKLLAHEEKREEEEKEESKDQRQHSSLVVVVPEERVKRRGNKPVRRERRETPEWLLKLMREENSFDDPKMIIDKILTKSDISTNQNRLLIPFKQITENNFLNEREVKMVEDNINNRKSRDHKGVNVILVDSEGKQWLLKLRRWDMNSSCNFALCSGWSKVVMHNNLTEGNTIRLWSFHSQDNLYFALIPPPPPPPLVPAPALDMDMDEALAPVVPASASAMDEVVDLGSDMAEDLASSSAQEASRLEDLEEEERTRRRIFVDYPRRRMLTFRACLQNNTPGDLDHAYVSRLYLRRRRRRLGRQVL